VNRYPVLLLPLSVGLCLFVFSACGSSDTASNDSLPVDNETTSIDEMEEFPDGPDRRDPRKQKGTRPETGEPITLEVIDDNANPVYARGLLSQDEISNGWISLFDGETLFGWQSNNPEVNWKVEQGVLSADVGPAGLLLTSVPFTNYELICEFRLEAGGNSGIFLRSTFNPQDLERDCLELNLAHEHPEGYTTGSLVSRAKVKEVVPPSTDWQTLHVIANRANILVELNGKEILSYRETAESPRLAGLIGLQQRIGKVEFRKVNLRPHPMKSLFNGANLEGWKEVPGSKARFTVEDNCLRVQGGLGFLETTDEYRNFIFQTEVRTRIPEINSGFFFRTEPGTEKAPSNGYEVQIHNGFKDQDRNQPNNSGSGAIFRRAEARRVVANDLEWYTMTLVANGPRYAVWVAGYEVVDWTDDRPADPNPRKGLRLEKGHISLQGHDPTTDCEFRGLSLSELPDDDGTAASVKVEPAPAPAKAQPATSSASPRETAAEKEKEKKVESPAKPGT